MAGPKKFLRLVSNRVKEVFVTVVSAGAANDGDLVGLGTNGRLDISVMPTGVAPEVKVCNASENLSAGDFVNFHINVGVLNVRRADATSNAKRTMGFVQAAVTSGASATVYGISNLNSFLTGLTIGADYALSNATPGGLILLSTAVFTAGQIVQPLGFATSATELWFTNVEDFVEVA